MRHLFIINPNAGPENATGTLIQQIQALPDTQIETYITRAPHDAVDYVRQRLSEHSDEPLRIYACGGDGTLNEVAHGAVGFPLAEIGCVPVGSGNDYIKSFGQGHPFLDLEAQLYAPARPVDLMQVNDRYAINVCNFGFDAHVCKTMINLRRTPIIGRRNAYTTGIIKALLTGRRTRCTLTVDGEPFHDGPLLLCTLANGTHVGGAYYCAPRSHNDDGLIEVTSITPIPLLRLPALIAPYREGVHFDDPRIAPHLHYRRGSTIQIDSPAPIDLCIDGEMLFGSHFEIKELPGAIHFIVPEKD